MTLSFHVIPALLNMGKYTRFVWTSYGIFVVVFSAMPILTKRRKKQLLAELKKIDASST